MELRVTRLYLVRNILHSSKQWEQIKMNKLLNDPNKTIDVNIFFINHCIYQRVYKHIHQTVYKQPKNNSFVNISFCTSFSIWNKDTEKKRDWGSNNSFFSHRLFSQCKKALERCSKHLQDRECFNSEILKLRLMIKLTREKVHTSGQSQLLMCCKM